MTLLRISSDVATKARAEADKFISDLEGRDPKDKIQALARESRVQYDLAYKYPPGWKSDTATLIGHYLEQEARALKSGTKTAADPSKVAVKAWMKKNIERYVDSKTGEVNMTTLAEEAAHEFDKDELGGWLDDETHWIWDAAQEVADAYEKKNKRGSTSKRATSPDQWEKGAELIEGGSKGDFNRIFGPKVADLQMQMDRIQKAFTDAAKQLENHKRFGVGRTESPALLLRPLREMAELTRLMHALGDRIDKAIDGALRDTGSSRSDL